MKYCEKCGEKLEKDQKFCIKCGKKVEEPKEEKTRPVQKEEKSKTPIEPKKEGLGTASLVIGIISLVLSLLINVLVLPLAIVGLILGIVNKAQKGKKFAGIILNIIAIVLSIIVLIAIILLMVNVTTKSDTKDPIKSIKSIERKVEKEVTTKDVEGTWNCKRYGSQNYTMTVEINSNKTFKVGLYDSFNENYAKGTYETEDSSDNSYKLDMEATEQYENGAKKDVVEDVEYTFTVRQLPHTTYTSLYDKANYKVYTCYKK